MKTYRITTLEGEWLGTIEATSEQEALDLWPRAGALVATPSPDEETEGNSVVCPTCGPGVRYDEDGFCAHCGMDLPAFHAPTTPPQAKREHEWTGSGGDRYRVAWSRERNRWALFDSIGLLHGTCFDFAAEIARLAGLTPPEGE